MQDKTASKFPKPTAEKLVAWAAIRAYWKKYKLKYADAAILDMEYEASLVD
jgi:hypothetical protein